MRAVLLLLAVLAVPVAGCTSALDCQLNGACVPGAAGPACVCDKGWTGADCGQLDLGPQRVAYGYGVEGGEGGQPVSSWGGGPPVFEEASKKWHFMVSEMAAGCGMCTWDRMSQAVHTVGDSPVGPFSRVATAIGPQTHNTLSTFSKVDGHHLIWSIGTGANPLSCNPPPPSGCQGGRTANCTGLRDPSGWPDPRCPIEMHPPTVHYAKSLDGPWSSAGEVKFNTTGTPNPGPDASYCFGTSNPAPLHLDNGTVLLITRGKDGGGTPRHLYHNLWLWRADAWNGTYQWVRGHGDGGALDIGGSGAQKIATEDPVLWRGRRGFHLLLHSHPDLTHAWSVDGLSWNWNGTVIGPPVIGGGDHERPRVLIDENGDIDAVFMSQECGPGDASRTLAFRANPQAPDL